MSKIYIVYIQKFYKNGSEKITARKVTANSKLQAISKVKRKWTTGSTRQVVSSAELIED
jgi:hypothetical protein